MNNFGWAIGMMAVFGLFIVVWIVAVIVGDDEPDSEDRIAEYHRRIERNAAKTRAGIR